MSDCIKQILVFLFSSQKISVPQVENVVGLCYDVIIEGKPLAKKVQIMVTVNEVQGFIDSGELVGFTYKDKYRLVNPVEFLTTKTGDVLLVGQEAGKGWRRYHLNGINNMVLVKTPDFLEA